MPALSVVIPHLNQPQALDLCLRSLRDQSGVHDLKEIVVVDNGSAVPPSEVCAAYPGVRLFNQSVAGPGPARNLGVAATSGDVLAFIDADCQADSNWLSAITTAFADADIQVTGGDVRIPRLGKKTTQIEAYESIYSYRMKEYIARQGFSGSGNLAVRRAVFDAVGPFAGIEVAEDRDWGLRARAVGYVTRYVPDMIIYHPARESFADLARKWDRHTAHDYEAYQSLRFGSLRWFFRSLAMAASPLAEIPRVLTSPRVSGFRERLLAFACLVRIRLYRARRMLGLMISGDGRAMSGAWNRD